MALHLTVHIDSRQPICGDWRADPEQAIYGGDILDDIEQEVECPDCRAVILVNYPELRANLECFGSWRGRRIVGPLERHCRRYRPELSSPEVLREVQFGAMLYLTCIFRGKANPLGTAINDMLHRHEYFDKRRRAGLK